MSYLKEEYNSFITYKIDTNSSIHFTENERYYFLYLTNGDFAIETIITKSDPVVAGSDQEDFETNHKIKANKKSSQINHPFSSKELEEGKKLYSRTHGKEFDLVLGSNNLAFTVPYAEVKINEIEIMGAELGDSVSFLVLDSEVGTYSTIPNYPLNQFGFDVKCSAGSYRRKSNYDADLYQGMQLYMVYNSKSAKKVYINYVLHELK
jgi:hypothetical protein